MTNLIEIIGENNHRISFSDPVYREDGYLSFYTVEITAFGLRAELKIENSAYGDDPSNFFEELSEFRNGWEGVKDIQIGSGDLIMRAKCDLSGHITLGAKLSTGYSPPSLDVEIMLQVELGKIDALSGKFNAFFRQASNN